MIRSRAFLSPRRTQNRPIIFQLLAPRPISTAPNRPYELTHKDWLSPSQALKLFQSLPDHRGAVVSVWAQYSTRRDYAPTEPLLILVVSKLARTREFDAIERVLAQIRAQPPCRLSDEFFYNVVKAVGGVGGRIRMAIDLITDMPSGFNVWPSAKTFNFVLNLLVSSRLFDEARELYLKAPMLGVEIDSCCLNILLKGLSEVGDFDGAYKVFDEFPLQRCRRNARSYATLMHGLCEGGRVDEAIGLVSRLEGEGVEVDAVVFNVLISGLRKDGRVDEGMQILERMVSKGCEPNEGTYLEVLYGLVDAGRFVEAKEFVGRMLGEGHKPSFAAYKKLVCGLCEEKLVEDVDWVLKKMVKQGFVPRMGMWKQILGCVLVGDNAYSLGAVMANADKRRESRLHQTALGRGTLADLKMRSLCCTESDGNGDVDRTRKGIMCGLVLGRSYSFPVVRGESDDFSAGT